MTGKHCSVPRKRPGAEASAEFKRGGPAISFTGDVVVCLLCLEHFLEGAWGFGVSIEQESDTVRQPALHNVPNTWMCECLGTDQESMFTKGGKISTGE